MFSSYENDSFGHDRELLESANKMSFVEGYAFLNVIFKKIEMTLNVALM